MNVTRRRVGVGCSLFFVSAAITSGVGALVFILVVGRVAGSVDCMATRAGLDNSRDLVERGEFQFEPVEGLRDEPGDVYVGDSGCATLDIDLRGTECLSRDRLQWYEPRSLVCDAGDIRAGRASLQAALRAGATQR